MYLKIILLLIILTGTALAQAEESKRLRLDDLVREALAANPDLKQMQHKLDVFEARIKPAATLPDPQIALGVNNLPVDTYTFDQEPMTQKSISITQGFPFFGKLGLKEDISELESKITSSGVQGIELQITKMVKTTYYNLFFIDKAIDVTRENRQLMENIAGLSKIKYETGIGIQRDFLNSQLALYKLDEKLIRLEQALAAQKGRMNILLNRPVDQPLGKTFQLAVETLPAKFTDLREAALKNNPLIQSKTFSIEQTDKARQLAYRNYWPDFAVKLSYGQRVNRPDFLSGVLSLSIPIYASNRQSQKVQEAAAANKSARSGYESAKNDVDLKLKILTDEIDKNKKLSDLYTNNIIPQAEQAYNSALAAYIHDKLDYTSLINNQVMLINYRLENYQIITEYNIKRAEIEQLMGQNL